MLKQLAKVFTPGDFQGKRVNPPLTKVIHLRLLLDIVPSSSADFTRSLRGCFRGGSVDVSFRFLSKQSKTSNAVEMPLLIFWLQAKELRLSVCCNTFRNFNGSWNKRQMYTAQTITTEWTAEKCLDRQGQSKQTRKSQSTEQSDGRKCRQTLHDQIAKNSLSSNSNNGKDDVD